MDYLRKFYISLGNIVLVDAMIGYFITVSESFKLYILILVLLFWLPTLGARIIQQRNGQ